jgi:hypothetical protein
MSPSLVVYLRDKSISKGPFITSLVYKNRDFGEKYPPTGSSIGYLNIDIFYSGFLASQR